jgi:hypothetical protein
MVPGPSDTLLVLGLPDVLAPEVSLMSWQDVD